MLPHLLALALTLASSFVSAALYPKDSLVKMIDQRGFRNALKENRTSVVAFVASWCGYCKAMVPEYSKAAVGLHPLIPLYAVDCDENRSLCAEQGVKGFPTVKLFPRGKEQLPILFEHPDRTANTFFYFATRRVPHKNKKLHSVEEIGPWVNDNFDQTRVLLLSTKDIPLMWKVLANKYRDDFAFANHRDRNGKASATLGYDAGTQHESKILVYPAGSAAPFLFEGVLKHKTISTFFDSILDGTANLTTHTDLPEESRMPTPEEKKTIKGHDADFHGAHGYTTRPDGTSKDGQTWEEDTSEREENPIYRAIRIQLEREEKDAKNSSEESIAESGDTDQVAFEIRMTAHSAHPSTTINSEVVPQISEICISKSATDRVVPSCASPVAEETSPTHEGVTASEAGHVKDEL